MAAPFVGFEQDLVGQHVQLLLHFALHVLAFEAAQDAAERALADRVACLLYTSGLQSVPRGQLFGLFDLDGVMPMYYFTLAVFALGYAFVLRVLNSPFGEVIRSVRDNEQRARSLGLSLIHI